MLQGLRGIFCSFRSGGVAVQPSRELVAEHNRKRVPIDRYVSSDIRRQMVSNYHVTEFPRSVLVDLMVFFFAPSLPVPHL